MAHRQQSPLMAALAIALLALSTNLPATAAAGDTLRVPLGQQGQNDVQRPPHGTNKEQVQAVYGEPQQKRGPTGTPAIYAWEYPDYTVYFEGDLVLHSVLKHQQQNDN